MLNIGLVAIASGLSAQALKVVVHLLHQRSWQPALFFSSGGMPSSHTATVTTLSILVADCEGVHGAVFSLVLVFSLYVVFEAAGLRQEVGKQAEVLNDLMDRMITTHRLDHTRLRELVGHTWAEVAGGFVFGAVFAYVALH
ncbi:MAG: divergent PAP2 family protein [Hyphomicrobiaceae bacterium]|nr:divergent PAP2 family protein [Hyphomicrobiaceae bacterium]